MRCVHVPIRSVHVVTKTYAPEPVPDRELGTPPTDVTVEYPPIRGLPAVGIFFL